MPCDLHVGTSGWHYEHWKGIFYPEKISSKDMLAFYLKHFDTVEINNSFYRLPETKTLKQWYASTPDRFLFAAKASRFLTHNKKLKNPEEPLHNVMSRFDVLKEKLGTVLFQLPPKWNANLERLEAFLDLLSSRYGSHRYTIEFRNPTWITPECFAILRRHNVAFCIYELAGVETPHEITADFAYVRLHGPGGKYQGSYSEPQLRRWAEEIERWRGSLRAVFVYFDNDQKAFAARNALKLKSYLKLQ